MHSPSLVAIVLLGVAQVSVAGIGKIARDVEYGIENAVDAALVPRQVTVTIATIPDYCLTSSSVPPESPAAVITTNTVAVTASLPTISSATASPPAISSGSVGAVSTLAAVIPASGTQIFGSSVMQSLTAIIPASGTQIFGSSVMQSLASQFSATASAQVSPNQPLATALPATVGPVIVSNSSASIISAMTSRISSTTLSSSVPSTSARGASAPAPSASAKSDGKQVVTGGMLTAVLTLFVLSGMQSLLF
ncbi:Mucin-5B [Xylographa soralifera]|nr:Mucin-5B [Xylographa soralifera]